MSTSMVVSTPRAVATTDAALLRRFWAKVDKSGDCWSWTGAKINWGYGQFRVGKDHMLAHRCSYEHATGETIPDGMMVCHRCDVPACVNPAHLFLGTAKDNMQDMLTKGRNAWASRTACSMGHEYTEGNTYMVGKARHCRACKSLHSIISYHRRKSA